MHTLIQGLRAGLETVRSCPGLGRLANAHRHINRTCLGGLGTCTHTQSPNVRTHTRTHTITITLTQAHGNAHETTHTPTPFCPSGARARCAARTGGRADGGGGGGYTDIQGADPKLARLLSYLSVGRDYRPCLVAAEAGRGRQVRVDRAAQGQPDPRGRPDDGHSSEYRTRSRVSKHGWRNRGDRGDLPLRAPSIPFPGWDPRDQYITKMGPF